MYQENNFPDFNSLFNRRPQARAQINGSILYPEIQGDAWFYQTSSGVLVVADIEGLPNPTGNCQSPIFAMHIHEGGSCSGNSADPFANAGMHYNPNNCRHPYHAGDLPPLFSVNGDAFLAVLTDRFTLNEIIGKTIIIHSSPDDFATQPSGNSGSKIACGEIRLYT
ncbi:MAG: superoxide dismutase family protein [Clostridia bacterium]|nr:superoxide dismutase family protein [Clostridia bacterium]